MADKFEHDPAAAADEEVEDEQVAKLHEQANTLRKFVGLMDQGLKESVKALPEAQETIRSSGVISRLLSPSPAFSLLLTCSCPSSAAPACRPPRSCCCATSSDTSRTPRARPLSQTALGMLMLGRRGKSGNESASNSDCSRYQAYLDHT